MVNIILASHGEFAAGILQSGSMIFGEQEGVAAITLMPHEGPDDVYQKMTAAIKSFESSDHILFLVDLWGGTPFNQASKIIEGHEDQWAVVSGLNLPMLIEAYAARLSMNSAQEIASYLVTAGKDGIKVQPESLMPEEASDASCSEQMPQGSIPPGTVLGDGKIDIVLARIDSRLLHGQVATAWTKATNPTRIIVVSDAVAKDDLRKKLIEQAAPPGVHANVIPIHKMIEVFKDPRFGNTRALLLFENPQDVARVIEGGVELPEVNVGSLAHSVGKVAVNKAISLSQEDIDAFEQLEQKGVIFDVRKVPNDSKASLDDLIKKAKTELASTK